MFCDAAVKGHISKKKNMQQTRSIKLRLLLCRGQPTVRCPVPVPGNIALHPNFQTPSSHI